MTSAEESNRPYLPAEPDEKDWTWVLRDRCPDCGFGAADVRFDQLAGTVRDLIPRYRAALGRPAATVRPSPQVWSVLEYGAHVRDVHRVFAERLALMLSLDDPLFANWDQDATAREDRYDLQDPGQVAEELTDAAEAWAAALDRVRADQWERTGRRSNGSVFTVETLGQYYLHDVVHHLRDIAA
ncbi:DinB family protein [Cellulomonas sp. NPDC089187]|uniref:DinB family protein n=1 Tax=Cellulomonas sp. NPDC089187 TaxID=3154970 RepID=UPI00343069BA